MPRRNTPDDRPFLSPSSYVILGLVRQLGRATSYDLKRTIDGSIGYFWDFPRSQLYVEPERLVRGGLLQQEQEVSGRRRRLFSVTAAGEEALGAWLEEPSASHTEIRDLGLLKLFFGALTDPLNVVALAKKQAVAHREHLALYERLDAQMEPNPKLAHQRLTIRLGMEFERVAIRFWEDVVSHPPEHRATRRAPSKAGRSAAPRRGGSETHLPLTTARRA
jgi:DNA-binding PadR family transcriptional regulator